MGVFEPFFTSELFLLWMGRDISLCFDGEHRQALSLFPFLLRYGQLLFLALAKGPRVLAV